MPKPNRIRKLRYNHDPVGCWRYGILPMRNRRTFNKWWYVHYIERMDTGRQIKLPWPLSPSSYYPKHYVETWLELFVLLQCFPEKIIGHKCNFATLVQLRTMLDTQVIKDFTDHETILLLWKLWKN